MRAEGLEPPRAEAHQDLNLARMPIPPRPRGCPGSGLTRDQRRASLLDSMIVAWRLERSGPATNFGGPIGRRPSRSRPSSCSSSCSPRRPRSRRIVTIAGFSLMTGGGGMGDRLPGLRPLYAFFAFLVARWNRGILPVAAALSMILAILCAVGADSWFARDKAGFEDAPAPGGADRPLGLHPRPAADHPDRGRPLRLQPEWHVEEERPIGSGEDYGAGATPDDGAPLPA